MKNIFLLRIVGLSLTLHLSLSDTAHALRGVEISEQQSNSLKEELSPVSAAGLEEGSDPTWNEESVALLGNALKKYARSHADPDPNAFMAE